MKKKLVYLLFCLLSLLGLAAGCMRAAAPTEEAEEPPINYTATATIDVAARSWQGEVTVDYPMPAPCAELWVWAPNGVRGATINGTAVTQETAGVYCRLSLDKSYPKGATIRLDMALGGDYPDPTALCSLYDIVPLVCAYEDGYLHPAPIDGRRYARVVGDEIRLTVTIAKTMVVATSAADFTRAYAGDMQVLTCLFSAQEGAHLAISPYFVRNTAEVGGVTWEYYATAPNSLTMQTLRTAAQNAADLWGETGKRRVNLVTGIEPVSVGGLCALEKGNVREVTRAVTAAWCMAPTDPAHPWVTESLREYLLYLYLSAYDEKAAAAQIAEARQAVTAYGMVHGATGEAAAMDAETAVYTTEGYDVLLRQKGLLLWYSLREIAGAAVDKAALSLAAREKIAPDDVTEAVCLSTGHDYRAFFDAWLRGKVLL